MPQPIEVRGFGGDGFVLTAQHVPQPFNRVSGVLTFKSNEGSIPFAEMDADGIKHHVSPETLEAFEQLLGGIST